MIRTGDEHRESIRDRREVWVDGEKVSDVTTHPALRPIIDARARIYDLAHEDATREIMTYVTPRAVNGAPSARSSRSPRRTGTRSGPPSRPSSTI
jgi:4-hydroxyphenylacetate 3-monooxygenase